MCPSGGEAGSLIIEQIRCSMPRSDRPGPPRPASQPSCGSGPAAEPSGTPATIPTAGCGNDLRARGR